MDVFTLMNPWPVAAITLAFCVWGAWNLFGAKEKPIPTGTKSADKMPMPKDSYPIVGSFGEMLMMEGGMDAFQVLAAKYEEELGPYVRINILGEIWYVLSNLNDAKTVLCSPSQFMKTDSYQNGLAQLIKDGVLTSEGEKWKRQRKFMAPFFHFQSLQKLASPISEITVDLLEVLNAKVNTGPIDVSFICRSVAVDIIAQVGLGIKLGTCAQGDPYNFIQSLTKSLTYCEWRGIGIPELFYPRLALEFRRSRKRIWDVVDKCIDDRLKKGVQEDEQDILADMIRTMQSTTDDTSWITPEELRNECTTILFAGSDTTANALACSFYELARNEDVYKKLLEEVEMVWLSDRPLLDKLSNMPYTDAVFKEVIRLYPGAPMVARQPTEDITIGEYHFPKGSNIIVSPWVLHRSKTLWKDPLAFRPERFIDGDEKLQPFQYIPFINGQRNCLGQHFAMLEAKIILPTVLSKYRFEIPEGQKEPMHLMKSTLWSNIVLNCVHR